MSEETEIRTNFATPLSAVKEASCGNCRNFSESDLRSLIVNGAKPGWWKGENKICFNLLSKVFEISSCVEGNQGDMVRNSLTTLDCDIILPKYISNLKRKATRIIEKCPDGKCSIVSDLYQLSNTAKGIAIGEDCEKYGITAEMLNNMLGGEASQAKGKNNSEQLSAEKSVIISNKLVVELNDYREKMNQPWSTLLSWLLFIKNENEDVDLKAFHCAVDRVIERKRNLMRNKHESVCEEFLAQIFKFPKKDVKSDPMDEQVRNIELLLENIEKSNSEIELLNGIVSDQSLVSTSKSQEIDTLRQNLSEIQAKHDEKSRELQIAMEKLSKLSSRNINKKIKRRDEMNVKLIGMSQQQQEEIEKKEIELRSQEERYNDMIDEKNEIIIRLNDKLDAALDAKFKAQRLKSYYKVKNKSLHSKKSNGLLFSKITELKSRIADLENDLEILQERLQEFLQSNEVKTFQNGRYIDEIRAVYEDLLCWGVGTENVEVVVRTVIKKLAGLDCGRLPKATFARYMYLEARQLAQIQVAERLLDGWESGNRTLHSDGTSKHGYHYATFDVTLDDGNVMVAGLRDMASGDAESQLDLLKEVLGDITSSVEDEHAEKKVMKSIKNLMSDRCIVQKKFNEILQTYRQSILPEVVEEWDILDDDEKSKVSRMNDLFCGLHYIVGLADQAEEALKVWDKLLYDDTKVGSLSQGGYSKGESGTLRLLRTVCKAVQAKGCERSGRAVSFADYVREKGVESIPLAPFKGNRFNIIFHNGGGVFYLHEHLKPFFDMMKDENKLLKAVHHDLEVSSFLAGCRALGLINKFITGPMWRVLAKEDISFMDMSARYQKLLDCFEKWARDSTPVLTGEAVVFDDVIVKRDMCHEKLIKEDPSWDPMTKQVLELIFGSFVVVTKRMLSDRSNFVCGGSCDNCVDRGCFYVTDGTNDALKVVQAVVELTGKTITCNMLKLSLLGSKQKIIQEESLDSLSNFGLFKKRFAPAVLLEKFLHSLIYHGVLAEITQQKGRSISLNIQLGPKVNCHSLRLNE